MHGETIKLQWLYFKWKYVPINVKSFLNSVSEGTGDNVREAFVHLCDRIYLPRLTSVWRSNFHSLFVQGREIFTGLLEAMPKLVPYKVHITTSGVPRNFVQGGSTNWVEDRGQRERGPGHGSPLVRCSGGSCNLVQEVSFHTVKFS